MSPSFTLDFCLQLISSKRVNFSIFVRKLTCSNFSSAINLCVSSLASKTFNLLQRSYFLYVTLPNSVSFHFFKSNFKAANFLASIKLGVSLEQIGCPPHLHFVDKIFHPQSHIFKTERNSTSLLTPTLQQNRKMV